MTGCLLLIIFLMEIGGMSVKIGVVDHNEIIDKQSFKIEKEFKDKT